MCPWCAVVKAPAEYRSSNPSDNFVSRVPTGVNTAYTDRISHVSRFTNVYKVCNVQGLGSSQRTDNVQEKSAAEATAPVIGSLGTFGIAPPELITLQNSPSGKAIHAMTPRPRPRSLVGLELHSYKPLIRVQVVQVQPSPTPQVHWLHLSYTNWKLELVKISRGWSASQPHYKTSELVVKSIWSI